MQTIERFQRSASGESATFFFYLTREISIQRGQEKKTHLEGLPQREIGKENILLLHVADPPAPSFCQPFTIQPDFTPVHAYTARQTIQQRRFAATYISNQTLSYLKQTHK